MHVEYLTGEGDAVGGVLHRSRWCPEECNRGFSDVHGIEVRHSNQRWEERETEREGICQYIKAVNL